MGSLQDPKTAMQHGPSMVALALAFAGLVSFGSGPLEERSGEFRKIVSSEPTAYFSISAPSLTVAYYYYCDVAWYFKSPAIATSLSSSMLRVPRTYPRTLRRT
jgi:hypothetical protein